MDLPWSPPTSEKYVLDKRSQKCFAVYQPYHTTGKARVLCSEADIKAAEDILNRIEKAKRQAVCDKIFVASTCQLKTQKDNIELTDDEIAEALGKRLKVTVSPSEVELLAAYIRITEDAQKESIGDWRNKFEGVGWSTAKNWRKYE